MLHLQIANTFLLRLFGLLAHGPLAPDEGLLLVPCRAVHTFFLGESIDIVFLDAQARECRCVHSLPPHCFAVQPDACMVVELPSGYCRRHVDYLERIRAALRPSVSLPLPTRAGRCR